MDAPQRFALGSCKIRGSNSNRTRTNHAASLCSQQCSALTAPVPAIPILIPISTESPPLPTHSRNIVVTPDVLTPAKPHSNF